MCCCWSIRVTVTVTGNLVVRACGELTDAVCKLVLSWWCRGRVARPVGGGEAGGCWAALDRAGAEAALAARGHDGAFLLRPSSSPQHECTLSVLHGARPFHVPVRRRADGWLALGTSKPNEQCFATVHDLVDFYTRETLVINSAGDKHLTILRLTPPASPDDHT